PVLDVRLDVLGDDLAGLDHLVEELAEVSLVPLFLAVALRLGGEQHLVEQVRRLGRRGRCLSAGLSLFSSHYFSSGLAASVSNCLARAMALSVLLRTSASNCSSLSLPSILPKSSVRRERMSSNSLSGATWAATRAGSKSSMFLKFSSTAILVLSPVSRLSTFI